MRDELTSELDGDSWQLNWGALLRTARQVSGLSLNELSAVTGLSKGYLSKLESGHPAAQNPSRATLAALARALPSFRSLAHILDPSLAPTTAFATAAPQVPAVVREAAGHIEPSPVKLGWRELETLIALITLEEAATTQPATRIALSRAVGRPVAEIEPILDALVGMGVLLRCPGRSHGMPPLYQRAPDFVARTGIARLGDALILAAALLSQSAAAPRKRPS